MEIIELSEIFDFENKIEHSILQSEIYQSICKEALKRQFRCNLQVIRLIQNGKYFSQLELEILNQNGDNIKMKYEPNCILMICEPICYSRYNKLNKIDLLLEDEFVDDLLNLQKELKSIE